MHFSCLLELQQQNKIYSSCQRKNIKTFKKLLRHDSIFISPNKDVKDFIAVFICALHFSCSFADSTIRGRCHPKIRTNVGMKYHNNSECKNGQIDSSALHYQRKQLFRYSNAIIHLYRSFCIIVINCMMNFAIISMYYNKKFFSLLHLTFLKFLFIYVK